MLWLLASVDIAFLTAKFSGRNQSELRVDLAFEKLSFCESQCVSFTAAFT